MASENEGKRETLAAIAAEIRSYGDRPPPKCAWLDIADRIEAIDSADAWRSLYMPGNAAALREALESFMVGSCVYPCVWSGYDPIDELCMRCAASPKADGDCPYEKASKALSAPPRQCDVGTPEEQAERFRNFCKMDYISEDCPDDCPLYRKDCSTIRCPFAWAQTPYEAQEGGKGDGV